MTRALLQYGGFWLTSNARVTPMESQKTIAFWVMASFMKDGLEISLTVRIALRRDEQGKYPLAKIMKEQTMTYAEAVNYLFKSYATDSNISKATDGNLAKKTLEFASQEKESHETSVQAVVQRTKIVR